MRRPRPGTSRDSGGGVAHSSDAMLASAVMDGTVAGVNDPARIESMWWHVIGQTCHDPDTGKRAFNEGDQSWLFDKNAKVVNDLANACMAASGLTDESADDMGKDSSDSLTAGDGEPLSDASTSG